jgi:hypothetical protein
VRHCVKMGSQLDAQKEYSWPSDHLFCSNVV